MSAGPCQPVGAGSGADVQAGQANSTRIEMRSLDSACNPYLAFAVLLAAGMKGIEQGLRLPPGAEDESWSMSDTERRALGYEELPHNLADALKVMETSELGGRDTR